MNDVNFEAWSSAELLAVEQALEAWVPADTPAALGVAMRYAVLDGGKRLRPLLVLAAAKAVEGQREAAMRAAVAVELIHRLFLGPRRHALHGRRCSAPRQAHGACGVW